MEDLRMRGAGLAMEGSEHSQGLWTLIPGLPDDVAVICLARVPLLVQLSMKTVCKAWKMAFSGEELHTLRQTERLQEPILWMTFGVTATDHLSADGRGPPASAVPLGAAQSVMPGVPRVEIPGVSAVGSSTKASDLGQGLGGQSISAVPGLTGVARNRESLTGVSVDGESAGVCGEGGVGNAVSTASRQVAAAESVSLPGSDAEQNSELGVLVERNTLGQNGGWARRQLALMFALWDPRLRLGRRIPLLLLASFSNATCQVLEACVDFQDHQCVSSGRHLYVFGGSFLDKSRRVVSYSSDIWQFDPLTWRWDRVARLAPSIRRCIVCPVSASCLAPSGTTPNHHHATGGDALPADAPGTAGMGSLALPSHSKGDVSMTSTSPMCRPARLGSSPWGGGARAGGREGRAKGEGEGNGDGKSFFVAATFFAQSAEILDVATRASLALPHLEAEPFFASSCVAAGPLVYVVPQAPSIFGPRKAQVLDTAKQRWTSVEHFWPQKGSLGASIAVVGSDLYGICAVERRVLPSGVRAALPRGTSLNLSGHGGSSSLPHGGVSASQGWVRDGPSNAGPVTAASAGNSLPPGGPGSATGGAFAAQQGMDISLPRGSVTERNLAGPPAEPPCGMRRSWPRGASPTAPCRCSTYRPPPVDEIFPNQAVLVKRNPALGTWDHVAPLATPPEMAGCVTDTCHHFVAAMEGKLYVLEVAANRSAVAAARLAGRSASEAGPALYSTYLHVLNPGCKSCPDVCQSPSPNPGSNLETAGLFHDVAPAEGAKWELSHALLSTHVVQGCGVLKV